VIVRSAAQFGLVPVPLSSLSPVVPVPFSERPAPPWIVESLADGVVMSRSAFADRFRDLVGVPPHR